MDMKTKPENYDELTRLISALLDEQLSEAESARLAAWLEADPQARRVYMQMIDQEVELSCLLPMDAQPAGLEKILPLVRPQEPAPSDRARRRLPRWLAAAAVVVVFAGAFALVLSHITGSKTDQPPQADRRAIETWSEDFERGLPAGWIGTLVASNLPPGSKQALATGRQNWPDADYHVIRTPEDWGNGLLTIEEQSTLHITYRIARGSHVNVFMHAMAPAAEGAAPGMFKLPSSDFPRMSLGWQTVSIPFSRFVRKVASPEGRQEFSGGPPRAGERVAVLAFSSLEPVDFVIDRIWVTPTGSGALETQDLTP
jgi:hypothetical protein